MGEHGGGCEQRLGTAEYAENIVWRRDGFANVDRGDQIVGDLGACQQLLLFDRNLEGDLHLRRLAVDFFLGRRAGHGVGDHRTDILQRAFPVVGQRRDRDEGAVRRTADILLADLGEQIAAPGARLRLEPPVDQRLRERIDHQPLIVGDGVIDRTPRPQDRVIDCARQFGLDQHTRLADRIVRAGAGGCNRIAESGRRRWPARSLPAGEPLADQGFHRRRGGIAGNDDHGVFGPVPARMEGANGVLTRALQGRLGADRRAARQQLSCVEGLLRCVHHPRCRAAALALFGEHDRHFGANVRFRQGRRGHHARQQLEALVEAGGRRIGQVELVDGLGRRGFGIGVVTESCAEPLPGWNRLRLAQILRLAEHQMLEQMGKAALAVLFVQRAGIDADADRNLIGRHAVAPHRIAQAIGQFAEHPVRIARHVAAAIEPRSGAGRTGGYRFRRRWRRGEQEDRQQQDKRAGDTARQFHGAGYSCETD